MKPPHPDSLPAAAKSEKVRKPGFFRRLERSVRRRRKEFSKTVKALFPPRKPAPPDFFSVDYPAAGEEVDSEFIVAGWYLPNDPNRPLELRALVAQKVCKILHGSNRPDVAKEFPNYPDELRALRCGFGTKIIVPPGQDTCRLRLQVKRGRQWCDFSSVDLKIKRRAPEAVSLSDASPATSAALAGVDQSVTFDLVLHVFPSDAIQLARLVDAVRHQSYQNWRLWILDDGEENLKAAALLSKDAMRDKRVTLLKGAINEKDAIFPELPAKLDTGYIAVLSETALLPPDWLAAWFFEIQEHPLPEAMAPASTHPARRFVKDETASTPVQRVRALAFFLPQYHEIPENNEWWGEGYTEWTNVRRAFPLYPGHNQPRRPHPDVGYYNLLDPDAREIQATLARSHGIYGFCYHFYWFRGKRLLEKPLDEMVRSGKPDFPFCICWANGNWSRHWDDGDEKILQLQTYSDEDDAAMIRAAMEYFRDPRYIRVNGKPLFIVYRPGQFADLRGTVERWRKTCRKDGMGEIYVCGVMSFGFGNESGHGLDALVQFPPHTLPAVKELPLRPEEIGVGDSFYGQLHRYDAFRQGYCDTRENGTKLFRGVMPGWDNTARKLEQSSIFHGSTPADYYNWLRNAVRQTEDHLEGDDRLVFINAWNEWGEGCYLEPDETHGYLYLQLTARALRLPIPEGWREIQPAGL